MQVRIAHRILDKKVGDRIPEYVLVTSSRESLEGHRVQAVVNLTWTYAGIDRLARYSEVESDQIVIFVEAGSHLALCDWMIPVVRHVLFARPEHLYRNPCHLLGDEHCLTDILL